MVDKWGVVVKPASTDDEADEGWEILGYGVNGKMRLNGLGRLTACEEAHGKRRGSYVQTLIRHQLIGYV